MRYKQTGYYLTKARSKLGDKLSSDSSPRWDSDDLLDFLNEGLVVLATTFKLLKQSKTVVVQPGEYQLDFSDFMLELHRAEYTPIGRLGFTTRAELDRKYGKAWITMTGTPTSIVFDNLNQGVFRLFPIPDDKQAELTPLDLVTSAMGGESDALSLDSVVIPLANYATSATATVTTTGFFGINDVTLVEAEVPYELTFFYDAKAIEYSHNSEVVVDSRLIPALIDYIVSEALLMGEDTENRSLADKFAKRFIAKAENVRAHDEAQHVELEGAVHYNNGFNLEYPLDNLRA